LPSLSDVRIEYNHEANAELVYELCAALVRQGLGTVENWKQSGGNALAFAQHAMMSGIGAGRGEPTLCVVFSPRQADEVQHALRIVERFVALNCELFQLVEVIAEWEKRFENPCVDRGEPSLRAA
jgi:hypothetical protein